MNAQIDLAGQLMTIEQAEALLKSLKADSNKTLNGVSIDVETMNSFLKECRKTLKDFTVPLV